MGQYFSGPDYEELIEDGVEFCYYYQYDDFNNNLLSYLQKASSLIPHISTVINYFLEKHKADVSNRVDNLVSNKIKMDKIKTAFNDLKNILEGIDRNIETLRSLKQSSERGDTFTYIICTLRQHESKFMCDNMLFFQLNVFLAYSTVYIEFLYQQAFNYETIYGSKNINKDVHLKSLNSKAEELSKFFERHCNILIYKKFSTIDLVHDGLGPATLVYKGQKITKIGHRASDRLMGVIISKYYPGLQNIVTCFNKFLEKLSLPYKVTLYDEYEYNKCCIFFDGMTDEYFESNNGNFKDDIFRKEGLKGGTNYDII